MSELKISAIIPALNEAPRIAGAVDRAWQAGADEVIVVDGHSDDDTRTVASGVDCRLVDSERGRAVQQNQGARAASGDVLLFLHADTWLASGAADQIRGALTDPRIEGGAFRQHIEAAGRIYRWLETGNAWRARRRGLPYGDQGIFLRRETFDELGGFPEVRLMEDLLLMRRLRRRCMPCLLPGPLYVSARRWQRHGPLRQTARNWLLLLALSLGVHPNRLAAYYATHE